MFDRSVFSTGLSLVQYINSGVTTGPANPARGGGGGTLGGRHFEDLFKKLAKIDVRFNDGQKSYRGVKPPYLATVDGQKN